MINKKYYCLFITFLIIFSNLKSVIGSNEANDTLQYEIEIVSDIDDCTDDYSSVYENLTQKLYYSVPPNEEDFQWTSTLIWDTNSIFEDTYTNQINGDMNSFKQYWKELPKYPFQLIFSCIDINEYINTILNLGLIYPNYETYDELIKRSYPKDIITEMGINTSIYKFDFGIQGEAILRRASDFNGSVILGMGESSRLKGHFTEPYIMNDEEFYPDLNISITHHIEFINEKLIGVELLGNVNGLLNGKTVERFIHIKIKQFGLQFTLDKEWNNSIGLINYLRIFIFDYTLLFAFSIILIYYIIIQRKKKLD